MTPKYFKGPFSSSGFKTGACQINPFSKSSYFETGRIDHSGFEIGEVVWLPPSFKTGVTPSFGLVIWLERILGTNTSLSIVNIMI
jgi:hypothetical protein